MASSKTGSTTSTKTTITLLSAQATGAVKEDATLAATGKFAAVDSKAGAVLTWSIKGGAVGKYGTLKLQQDGTWTYQLANDSSAVQSLASGESRTDVFSIMVTDAFGASLSQSVTITVGGTNEKPVIAATAGQDAGFVEEGGISKATGQFSATGDRAATLAWSVDGGGAGSYGTMTVDASGGWSYTLDDARPAVQALVTGQSVTETFSVRVTDDTGQTASRDVTVTIAGEDDAPVIEVVPGADLGTLVEDGDVVVATGKLDAHTADAGVTLAWSTVKVDGQGSYGVLQVAQDGGWTYTLDPTTAEVQALVAGQSLQDVFNVEVTDSRGYTAKTPVTITIHGADDLPVISATGLSGAVQEDLWLTTVGQAAASSVDAGALLAWSSAGAGAYGTLSIDASGAWSYALDNANVDVQALAAGQTLTDSIAVSVVDQKGMAVGAAVTITIHGSDEVDNPTTVVTDPTGGGGTVGGTPVDETGGGGTNSGGVNSGKNVPDGVTGTVVSDSPTVSYTVYGGTSTGTAPAWTGPSPFTTLSEPEVAAQVGSIFGATPGLSVDAGSVKVVSGAHSVMHYDGSLPLGIGAGLLLTSGGTPATENTAGWFSVDNGMSGDADLNAVVQTVFPTTGYDATTISFDFTVDDPTVTGIRFNAQFGSDEYPEWVDTIFVDIGAILVNGANVALFDPSNPLTPLSIIGSNLSANYFIDNTDGHLPIEYDGLTNMLEIFAPVHQGLNTIKIGISDTGDHIYDSGLFVSNLRGTSYGTSGVYLEHSGGSTGESYSGGYEAEVFDANDGDDSVLAQEGNDIVLGGAGNDSLHGGGGADILEGGAGADRFVYDAVNDSRPGASDRIVDFDAASGDLIDLSAIDADASTPGDEAFSLVDALAGHAGELAVEVQADGSWRVSADVDGDAIADLVIDVVSTAPLGAGDFLL